MKYTHIIWDFNGTILDDVSIGIDAVNAMLSRREMKTIDSVDEYRRIFGFPIIDYYRRCGFDFEKDDYESVLAPEWVREYNDREHNAVLCVGVRDALELFSQNNIKQSVLSASREDMLCAQIERLGLGGYFEHIIGCDNFFAYGKTELCVNFVKRNNSDRYILIGDSTHDAEVARAARIDCALVLTGHMNRETLEKCGCEIFENTADFAQWVIK